MVKRSFVFLLFLVETGSIESNISSCHMVIAHRGFTKDMPENTIAAFDAARALGARGIECHIRLTADNVPIVSLTDTYTDASGRLLFSQTKGMDIIARRAQGSRRVLLLAELFDYIVQQSGTEFYIEIVDTMPGVAQHIAHAIQAIHAWDRVCIVGAPALLTEARALLAEFPHARLGACVGMGEIPFPESTVVFMGWHRDSETGKNTFRKSYSLPQLRKAKRKLERDGFEVIGRIVNEQEEMEFFLAADFDNVVTDNVPLAAQYFK